MAALIFLLSDSRPRFSPSSDMCQVFVYTNNHSDERHTVYDYIYACHQFHTTRHFWIYDATPPPPPPIWLKSCFFKSTDKMLLNIRYTFGSVMQPTSKTWWTCVRHKGKHCCATGKWKCSVNLPFTKSLKQLKHHTWHHFLKVYNAADTNQLTQF